MNNVIEFKLVVQDEFSEFTEVYVDGEYRGTNDQLTIEDVLVWANGKEVVYIVEGYFS